ncbi:biotin/lipoyl-containing protein [Desulfosporosinus sp. BICA1-9]|uniref:biotin/lipoyl-containing protein n=1 Tax=Desulfosporosinus sp. BICA1-9 TaxID=1531958 RepID=UPI00054B8A72|nr:biotin/lipoyl-containing protein [Desulfosporosinus sp. BICA1-9]KJS85356.1 MAG: carboxylesterase [Desulfosporosinus sp. BICA1-9]HBW37202.1 acetyl-CoA carboxylase biotin carboxyl carrier protein subunit [Desulfosporosinus sp.]
MKYNVTINGKRFEVEVERITESKDLTKRASKNVMEAPSVNPEKFRNTSSSQGTSAGETIKAPMPGTILSIKVNEGQTVKKGEVLFILEAMKMENEIMAPRDAVVAKLMVSNHTQVKMGDSLILLK